MISSFIQILQKIIYGILTEVFKPILTDILHVFIDYFMSVIWSMWSEWLVGILAVVCSLVDFVESIFNVFAGITPVKMYEKDMYLLDALFQMDQVTLAFASITLMAVAISFLFTIYKTAKSISDMALEDKNPVSKVLANGMKAAVTFMMIPFLCVVLLQISSTVTNQVINAFGKAQEGQSTTGTIIFLTAGMDADKETAGRKNPVTGIAEEKEKNRKPSLGDKVRAPYMNGEKDYKSMPTVKKDFYPSNFNFIEGFASSIMMLFILAGAAMMFIRRAFDLLLLYLVSPFFVATIPLDDGATFAKWREMFVAKFFSGFGVIFAMRYYLLLVPVLAGSELCLYDLELPGGTTINNVLKLFLIVGGAWAVYKSQSLIMQILNHEAAMAEQQAGALISGMIIGSATTAANLGMAAATGGSSAALSGLGGLSGAGGAMGGLGSLGDMASSAGNMASAAGRMMTSETDNQKFNGR